MPEAPSDLLAALQAVLPPGMALGWADPVADYPRIPGEEVPNAVPARQREFAAGRHAARMAMQAAGPPAVALPSGADRAPVWPDGVIGSLTHSHRLCLAVAGQTGALSGIGIDLEPATFLERNLWDSILLPEEQIALMRAPADQRGILAKTIFSAKEAAYKAQYPTSRTLFGFEVMVIELAEDRFTAIFRDPVPPFAAGYRIEGRIIQAEGQIVTPAFL